jgi:hypothetical protein
MQYNYPDWSEKDAKAGRYTVNSKVAYKSSDGIERVFQANEDYVGSIKPPDSDDTWDYLEDIVYDWSSGMEYKIGSVVNYNGIQYVATKRYRGGSLPPNEELDPDGIRTWMLNYEDGEEPVTPFFYRKKFGAMSFTEVYPSANFMEGIDYNGIPIYRPDEDNNYISGESTPENDRFYSQRADNIILQFPSNLDRRPEQQLANSVMEAHPYHDIYVTGETKYINQKPYFEWFQNAKHQSEIRDKFWGDYVNYKSETRFFTPKRTIPYWSNRFEWELDEQSFSKLKNGVSLEYYPNESSDNFELIMPEFTRNITISSPSSFLFAGYGGPESVSEITPIWVSSSGGALVVDPITGEESPYYSTKKEIYVKPKNICVDSVKITFYFEVAKTVCWVSGYTEYGQPMIECATPVLSYFKQTYEYNELTRTATADWTDRFKSKQYKMVENPDYDPDCVSEDDFNPCPPEYIRVEDTDHPDTSIEMRPYLEISGGQSSVNIIGWSIS